VTSESFRETVEELGLELLPAGINDEEARERLLEGHPEFVSLPVEERSRRVVVDLFVRVLTPTILADLPRLVGWEPDVVVREEGEFAGPIIAAKARVPWVDHGWGPMRPPGQVADAAAALEPLWRAHGLEPDAPGGAYRWLYLDPCPPSLQFSYAASVEVAHLVRPETPRSSRSVSDLDWVSDLRRPLVYVTLGTVPVMAGDLKFFRIVIAALAGDNELVVTVGPQGDPTALGPLPEGVHVERFIPQTALLPHCALLISNGGAGSTLGALSCGVPVLAVPATPPSQRRNADALLACGAGRRLERSELSVESVRREADTILSDPSYRAVAERIAAEIVAMPGIDHAARLVEQIAAERRPIPGARPKSTNE
jgi:UDP:flavonoid glycosyltransferase YjiC (YdhE family)